MLQEICQKNHNSNILSYCESDLMYIEVQTKRHIMYTAKVAKIIHQHCIYYRSINFVHEYSVFLVPTLDSY